jgi:hypothetical protein
VAFIVALGMQAVPLAANAQPAPAGLEEKFAAIRPAFVKVWNADSCAQGEPLSDYVDHWVHDYYVVGFGEGGGWFAQSALLLSKIPAGSQRTAIAARLQILGARIAAEWAKPNDCRKIATFGPQSISAYSSVLEPYLESPGPIDPAALSATLKRIEAAVRTALM